ncbi:MAG: hypothetical protein ACLP1D_08555 [Xanthobacteraceae bacterium]|jgi:hypothetical protein
MLASPELPVLLNRHSIRNHDWLSRQARQLREQGAFTFCANFRPAHRCKLRSDLLPLSGLIYLNEARRELLAY